MYEAKSFETFFLTQEHETAVKQRVALAVLALAKLQMTTEAEADQDEYDDHFRSLRNAILAIEANLPTSLEGIQREYDKCQERREAAEALIKDVAAQRDGIGQKLTEALSLIAEMRRQEENRLREHNPASPEVRAKVLALTDGKCAYCNSVVSPGKDDGIPEFVVEHVVPKSAGGPDHIANFVPACSLCNSQKSAGHVVEFIRKKTGCM